MIDDYEPMIPDSWWDRQVGGSPEEKMIARLSEENTKLKDFVYDMWNDMNVYHVQHESPDSSDMDFYRDRMREIGIEVSE